MPAVSSHPPGSFCWIELSTSDAAAARSFYTQLFGWTVNEMPMGEMGTYFIFQHGGRDCAAMYQHDPGEAIPPNWLSYIAVTDAEAAAAQAETLGALIMKGPFDVFDSGRMAVLSDPQGAVFAIWQAKSNIGVGVRDEPGTLCWNELQARDADAAKTFYTSLFPWRMKDSPDYTEWHLGENAVGGMLRSKPGMPPTWMPYFAVEDCDGAVEKARSQGAHALVPAMDIAGVGRFSVLADPQGAVFAVIRLQM